MFKLHSICIEYPKLKFYFDLKSVVACHACSCVTLDDELTICEIQNVLHISLVTRECGPLGYKIVSFCSTGETKHMLWERASYLWSLFRQPLIQDHWSAPLIISSTVICQIRLSHLSHSFLGVFSIICLTVCVLAFIISYFPTMIESLIWSLVTRYFTMLRVTLALFCFLTIVYWRLWWFMTISYIYCES